MRFNFLKPWRERFGLKIFGVVTVFLAVVSLVFIAFFIRHQNVSLKNKLRENGELLAGILSSSVRLGVFTEDKELLANTVEGIFQLGNVLEVSVFSLKKELLTKQKTSGMRGLGRSLRMDEKRRKKIFKKLRSFQPLYCQEGKDTIEVWSPVMAGAGYATEESLITELHPVPRKRRVIGFIGVTVDKRGLNKTIKNLVFMSFIIGGVFLALGAGVVYLLAKRITKPLNRLTEAVKTLGKVGSVEKVPVETQDEVGRLAEAFNNMSESLRTRDEEKKRLEEQLWHAQKMEAVGTLAGGIAHDFNNILTAIIGYGNLLQMEIYENDSARSEVEQILASAERAANLTRSLLAFSRKQLIQSQPITLNENIKDVEKLLTRLIREDIEIKLRLSSEDLIVMADPGQLEQVLMNFATNARDAMPGGGVLTITTESVELKREFFSAHGPEKPGKYALISISDTGLGMDKKTRERIFDPFFTTKEVGRGTGLGLSMIYGIIKQHEGYIDVSSKPGKGTTFRVYLPLTESEVDKKKKLESLSRLEGGEETVLIAEDDDSVRTLSKEVLEQSGYKVIEAIDGEDAVGKFDENKEKIQLVLLDVIMPKKNGKEAYEEIRKIRPDIKTVFISGYSSDILHDYDIMEEGINFIAKPVSPEVLLRKVREVLDKKE